MVEPQHGILQPAIISLQQRFYDKIAYGGKESIVDGNLRITRMADGSIITMRKVSHSDGTPVVDINIERSTHSGGLRKQKIHFIQEDS